MSEFRTLADVLRARGKLGPYGPQDSPPEPPAVIEPDPAAVRAWAAEHGIEIRGRGPIPEVVLEQYRKAAS
jgi:hypothetical protein